jgi:4-hydroxy 2-oxovalerate aldolase
MVQLYDVTLRDGNHALRHSLNSQFVKQYCQLAEESQVWAIEVGHGNGLGASSFLVGKSEYSDFDLISQARQSLNKVLLGVHAIPGFATLKKDLIPAVNLGVDIFRIATHVTEADTAEKHIEYLASQNLLVHGVLMMSHMIDEDKLIDQVRLMKKYGATAVILMDSAGYFLPQDVSNRVDRIKQNLDIQVGFHAHNNLGSAVANAMSAINAGASLVDGASMGLGAGAGNAQLENIVATFNRSGKIEVELNNFLRMSEIVENNYPDQLPRPNSSSVQSGMSGVFSGYAPQVKSISHELGIEISILWNEIGRRKLVPGQESMIREIAQDLMNL